MGHPGLFLRATQMYCTVRNSVKSPIVIRLMILRFRPSLTSFIRKLGVQAWGDKVGVVKSSRIFFLQKKTQVGFVHDTLLLVSKIAVEDNPEEGFPLTNIRNTGNE